MTRVVFVVNGEPASAMGVRAQSFARHLGDEFDVRIEYRVGGKLAAAKRFFAFLRAERPAVTYVFDMGYSGVLAAAAHRLLARNRLVIDTGDVIYELARSAGLRGRVGLRLTWLLERFSLWIADAIVVRGTFHKAHLAEEGVHDVTVVQDGVDVAEFRPTDGRRVRGELGLGDTLTVGLVGSSVWSERLQMCYGWELVELVRILHDIPVYGILVGGGSGIERLKRRAEECGVADRIRFLGHVPYEELPEYLAAMDVCLSTQTNDLVGRVRTTGKLPLYLANGRYVLASNVGEASLVLAPEMLVDYEGVKDEQYPEKLARRVAEIAREPERLARAADHTRIARERFDYLVLAARLSELLRRISGIPAGRANGRTSLVGSPDT